MTSLAAILDFFIQIGLCPLSIFLHGENECSWKKLAKFKNLVAEPFESHIPPNLGARRMTVSYTHLTLPTKA